MGSTYGRWPPRFVAVWPDRLNAVTTQGRECSGTARSAVLDPSGRLGPDGRQLLLGKRLEIEESEAAVIRQAFGWYADGVGVSSITARLNAAGSRRYSYNAVKGWLTNQKYMGRTVWNQRRYERRPGTHAKVARMLPETDWKIYDRPELRIIDNDTWARVQGPTGGGAGATNRATGLMRGRDAVLHSRHLFSGFMRCGLCNGAVTVVSGGYGGTPGMAVKRASKQGTDVLCQPADDSSEDCQYNAPRRPSGIPVRGPETIDPRDGRRAVGSSECID